MKEVTKAETKAETKIETPSADAKKLALRCKTLESQLRQSVTKKEHHEITTKLEKQIDTLEKDLSRAREENERTIAINKQIAGVEELVSSLTKVASAQGKTLHSIEEDASAKGETLGTQGKAIEAIAMKLAQGTVPSHIHLQSLSKIRELEEEKRGMVRRSDYASIEARCEELSRQLGTMVASSDYALLKEKFDESTRQIADMVPSHDYSALKQRAEELENNISSMVPREKLASSEDRVMELEARLAEHVPQSVYDELVSRVVSLAEAITGGALQPEEAQAEPQPEAVEAEPIAQAAHEVEGAGDAQGESSIPEVAEPLPQVAEPIIQESAPATAEPAAPESPIPEISEIQSQLAEINSQAQEAKGEDAAIGSPQTVTLAFAFSGTDVAARTGQEFAQAIEKLPTDVLEFHVRNGDFDRWFAGALSDEASAEAVRKIREEGASGEELRSRLASSMTKYTLVVEVVTPDAQTAQG
jgi:HPt (histidine-containing phosphotransfer) domain-containing protein